MAEQLPSGVLVTNVSIDHNIPTFTTESINLIQKSKDRGIHRLEGSIDVSMYDETAQREWAGFIARCRGRSREIEVDLPKHFKSDVRVNPRLTTEASVGATEANLGAFTGTITAGTLITFPNDTKTYVVEEGASSGGTIKFYPPLRRLQPFGSTVRVVDPVMTVRFKEDVQTINYGTGHMVTATLDFVEAL